MKIERRAMKELIEKIKAEEQFVYCFDPTVTDNEKKLRSEFNKGLHKAIKIIESSKPKWIDSPDKKGSWWFLSPDETVSCATIIEVGGELYREERDTHIYHTSSYIGKWQKAIMPEKE
jgi:hypothetical protein